MDLGAIRCITTERFMGIAEVPIPCIGVRGTGVLGLLPESGFCGYPVIISGLPTNVCGDGREKNRNVFILKVDVVFARGKGGVCRGGGDLTPTACSGHAPFKD